MSSFSGTPGLNQARMLFVSGPPETVYDTANATPLTHRLLHAAEWPPLTHDLEVVDSANFASGANTDFPQSDIEIEQRMEGQKITLWAGIESVPMMLAKAVNNDVYSATGKHVITAADVPAFIAGTTMEEHTNGLTADVNRDNRFTGICLDDFELSWGQPGFATVAFTPKGSGKRSTPAQSSDLIVPNKFLTTSKIRTSFQQADTLGTTLADAAPASFPATAGTFNAADSGAVQVSHLLKKATLRWQNGLTDGRYGGVSSDGNSYAGQPFAASRACFLDVELLLDETTELFLRAFSNRSVVNEFAWLIDFAGHTANYGGRIALMIASLIASPKRSSTRGIVSMTMTFQLRKSSTTVGTPLLLATFHNGDTAAYSVAA